MSYRRQNLTGESLEQLREYVAKELEALERAFSLVEFSRYKTRFSPPDRIYEGMVVLADGASWNPGAGAGFYGYYGGSWKKLG